MKKEDINKSKIQNPKSNNFQEQPQNSEHNQQAQSQKPKAQDTEIEELKLQLESEKSKRIYLMADFENYKKRVESERSTFGAIANMGLILDILEVSDDINLGLNDENLDLNRAKESLNIAKDKLVSAALKAGIEKIEVKVGDDFDKNKMEAVIAVSDEKNKNKVIAVISSAYKYKDQDTILKAAKVVVGK